MNHSKLILKFFEEQCIWYDAFSRLNERLEKTGNIVENKSILYVHFKNWLAAKKMAMDVSKTEFFQSVENEIFPSIQLLKEDEELIKGASNGIKKTNNGQCYWFIITKKKLGEIWKNLSKKEEPYKTGSEFGEILSGFASITASDNENDDERTFEYQDSMDQLYYFRENYERLHKQGKTIDKQEFDLISKPYKKFVRQLKLATNSRELFLKDDLRLLIFTLDKYDSDIERRIRFRNPPRDDCYDMINS